MTWEFINFIQQRATLHHDLIILLLDVKAKIFVTNVVKTVIMLNLACSHFYNVSKLKKDLCHMHHNHYHCLSALHP